MPGFSGSSLPHKIWGMITTEPTDNYALRFFSINKNDAEMNVRLEIKSLNMLSRINCLRQIKKESCFRRQSEIPKANSRRRKQMWSADLQRWGSKTCSLEATSIPNVQLPFSSFATSWPQGQQAVLTIGQPFFVLFFLFAGETIIF